MKKSSNILWLLLSIALVSCSGRRTAGILEFADAQHAETRFKIRDLAVGETYCFSPTTDWRASFPTDVSKQKITVTLSNQSNAEITYPDPDWIRTEDDYAEPWLTLSPNHSDVLYQGPLGDFHTRLKTKSSGTGADGLLSVRFEEPPPQMDSFYLVAVWSDGP